MRFWPRSSGAGGALWVNCRHGAPEYQFKPAEIEQLPFHFTFFLFLSLCFDGFKNWRYGALEYQFKPTEEQSLPEGFFHFITCFFLDLICFLVFVPLGF